MGVYVPEMRLKPNPRHEAMCIAAVATASFQRSRWCFSLLALPQSANRLPGGAKISEIT